MKIKTITCHDVYNAGASLQAYALATYLNQLGYDTKIIDYKPDYLSKHHILWGGINPVYNKPLLREAYCLLKLPGRLRRRFSKRKRAFDQFTQGYLPKTENRYQSVDELRKNPPEADVYFAGSDQIWNTQFPNGKDPAFYLDFVPKSAVKASYAASFSAEFVDEAWRNQIRTWLMDFDRISVRETSGVRLIEGLGISGTVQVLDPVFLLDQQQWEGLEKRVEDHEPYVLIYDFDDNVTMAEFAREIADKNGWKLYSYLKHHGCDRCFDQTGPREFLWLIHHAELVVSNSFHATAFSILYQKPFYVFDRHEKLNSRMRDLLHSLELDSRLIASLVHTQASLDVDYKIPTMKLAVLQNQSKEYVSDVLMITRNSKYD